MSGHCQGARSGAHPALPCAGCSGARGGRGSRCPAGLGGFVGERRAAASRTEAGVWRAVGAAGARGASRVRGPAAAPAGACARGPLGPWCVRGVCVAECRAACTSHAWDAALVSPSLSPAASAGEAAQLRTRDGQTQVHASDSPAIRVAWVTWRF